MGTRGLYGLRKNGIDKLTYNHCDSYPTWLGYSVANFCASHTVQQLNDFYHSIELRDENSHPTESEIDWAVSANVADFSVDSQSANSWYCLLRELQGDLEAAYKLAERTGVCFFTDNNSFIRDSLFCEYAYIINLDTERLEFWVGFQKSPYTHNRYGTESDNGYYPCKLIAEFSLENLDAKKAVEKMVEIMEVSAHETF